MQNLLAILEEADMAKIRIFWQERKSKKVKLEVKSKSEKNSDNKVKSAIKKIAIIKSSQTAIIIGEILIYF